MNLVELRQALESMTENEGRCLTLSLDLSPDATGRPVSHSSFRAALSAAVEANPDDAEWLEGIREPLGAIIDEATEDGARGLFMALNDNRSLRLDTHLPLRNHLRVAERPWTFEVERQLYLLARPVVAIDVSRSEVSIYRVAEAEITEHESLERDEHWTRKTHGRTAVGSSGAGGTAAGGLHSRSSIERAVEEHRAADARAAADAIASNWNDGDLLLIVGSQEPRAELIHELPERVAASLIDEHPGPLPNDERKLLELIGDISTEHQLAAGDRLAEAIVAGAGENIARGRAAVAEMLEGGRAGTLVLHEDAVAHWGSATDARLHQPPWDDAPYEQMLVQAHATSAEIAFCRLPALLEQHEGVAAQLRW